MCSEFRLFDVSTIEDVGAIVSLAITALTPSSLISAGLEPAIVGGMDSLSYSSSVHLETYSLKFVLSPPVKVLCVLFRAHLSPWVQDPRICQRTHAGVPLIFGARLRCLP